ncbi:centromere protein C-like [Cucurbita pepo subsp. pepo]|uniref:centromere protein C-like n=1 Tax=Cucurbita pepo subsp. pepo TaxID=3664 RepID=UPI000C9D70E1|nr:centromere protein C-like [Cucurbita pepo subsp. pepo]XP_023514572.1 centromere protein C-like [Cucurbita pepo subsp. pepo]
MVDEEARLSVVIDPLAAYSGIYLFPSAFGIFPDPSKPHGIGTDLDAIHNHLKSMVSRNPSKLKEQARSILDGNSNLMQSEAATFLANNEKKEEATVKAEENPQERRPALNRKRARFSLKPDARQPPVSLEPKIDIKQLKDPEELFLAYERLENAKREIRKQTEAVLKDLNLQNPSTNIRQRRPGILGRSVRYKLQYSSIKSENDQNVEPSQVTFESGNISVSIPGTEKDSRPIINSENKTDEDVSFEDEEGEEEFFASIAKVENKVDKILDELLSANCEDLEGDRAINMLQECLQIKPINLEKLNLPDLEATRTVNLKSSTGNLPKRSFSVDNQLQMLETLKSKQDDENSFLCTPPSMRSPLASLSALNEQILLSKSSCVPFSAQDIDQSPARNPSLFELSNHLSDAVGIAEQSSVSKLKSLLTKYGGAVANGIKSPKVLIEDADSICKISSSNVSNQVGGFAALSGTQASMEAKDISGSCAEVEANEKLSCFEAQEDAVANATNASDDEMEDHAGSASEQPSTSKVDRIKGYPVGIQSQLDQSTATCPENIVDGPFRSSGTDHHDKVKPKSRASKERKGKKICGRQSFAGAGTTWQYGMRRSTRFKTRPLEYWKGERLLYGRVHESLATVIGLKYVSPAKGNGQPTLKVKSLVSDKYKDLVELAALH